MREDLTRGIWGRKLPQKSWLRAFRKDEEVWAGSRACVLFVFYLFDCIKSWLHITLSLVMASKLLGFPDSSVGKGSVCNGSLPGRFTEEGIDYSLQYSWASLVAQLVKNLPANQRPGFDPWVGKISWRRERPPTPVFWPGEFRGLYSPRDYKELDTTE